MLRVIYKEMDQSLLSFYHSFFLAVETRKNIGMLFEVLMLFCAFLEFETAHASYVGDNWY